MSKIVSIRDNLPAENPVVLEEKPVGDISLEEMVAELEAALETEKKKYRQLKETLCVEALQEVLDEHECTLTPMPNGKVTVVWKG